MDLNGAAWRKSSYSGGNGGQCIEVTIPPGRDTTPAGPCAIRDSQDPDGPVLAFGPAQWRRFTAGIKTRNSALT